VDTAAFKRLQVEWDKLARTTDELGAEVNVARQAHSDTKLLVKEKMKELAVEKG
jgi:hypothetical protein